MSFWVLGGLRGMRVRLDPLAPPPVAAAVNRAGGSSPDYTVRPADFAAQLEWLVGHGHHLVSVNEGNGGLGGAPDAAGPSGAAQLR